MFYIDRYLDSEIDLDVDTDRYTTHMNPLVRHR